ncbi:MAG TPA: SUMF1/EgtB/PvdO family nonheme iron enzyme [Reyranella sp.]|nr:SUMF1/EgtB/PvdO family nonheme iron enzyme [Reyranella sp.]
MRNRRWPAALLAASTLASMPVLAQAPRPPAPASPAIAWTRDDWNPAPKPDDFILPLPCKGAIALRRVVTGPPRAPGKTNQLEDRMVTLGSADDPLKYVDYLYNDYIAGGFFAPDGQRYYLIGKYEVTVQQYEAVMGDGSCKPTVSDKAGLPISSVSWYDAVEFTRRLNKWLYAERLDALPRSNGRPGFVRLPSEVEWEFAARGGTAVSDAQRAAETFVPAGGNLGEYAWFAGPESSAGQLRLIGGLKPNPLDLYDMLGNVEELMLEPFRLNRAGRLHGQLGGVVARGGSFRTPRESMRTAARTEFAAYDETSKQELRASTFGFRIMIGATALNREEQAATIEKEWTEARRTDTSVAGKDALTILDGLLKQANQAEKARMQAAVEQLNKEIVQRNELQGRAAKTLISSATIILSNMRYMADNFDQLNKLSAGADKPGVVGDIARNSKKKLEEQEPKFELWSSVYADVIQQLARDFRDEEVKAQGEALKAELAGRGRDYDRPGVDDVLASVAEYRQNRLTDPAKILRKAVGQRPWLKPL